MTSTFDQRLGFLAGSDLNLELARINRGIEKEGLRVTKQGLLSQAPHPKTLGSALTHPHITTDYSEALLEFITPVRHNAEEVIGFLRDIHSFTYSQLDEELIWVASMPCFIGGEESIPIADYGKSNIGQLKHIYRIGLAHRYGKMMQTIAGIHYNFSLPDTFWPRYQALTGLNSTPQDFRTDQYFGLIRNFKRFSWLVLYLFGASPALCTCFLKDQPHQLKTLSDHTVFMPDATSLRMGDLGYNNSTQQQLNVSYNSLKQYVKSLSRVINTPHPPYEEIGVLRDGSYRQLNSNVLQIENEYYSDIRPKRVTPSGKKPLDILTSQGVEYIEVRNLDINPFILVGIDEPQVRFLDCFLLYCLLEESPLIDDKECRINNGNKQKVVNQGRSPRLQLMASSGHQRPLEELSNEMFDDIEAIAETLDTAVGGHDHIDAVKLQKEKLSNPGSIPSARILDSLNRGSHSYFDFSMERTLAIRDLFKATPPTADKMDYFHKLAESSMARQQTIEDNDRLAFADFLKQYLGVAG